MIDKKPITRFFNLFIIIRHLWNYRGLIWMMSRREVAARYKGSVVGIGWAFVQPLLMLGVYTFVFSVIFNARWGLGTDETRSSFALVLFLGLITFRVFSEMLNVSSDMVVRNSNFVKKVLFPLEILPVVQLLSILIHALLSLLIVIIGALFILHHIPLTALLLPIIWLPVILFSLACGYYLAAVGVFFRDIRANTNVLTTVLFYASGIFYPISAVPEKFQILLKMNPIAILVEYSRKVFFWGITPDWSAYVVWLSVSVVMCVSGFVCFMKVKRAFADVL
jgi:lipopolysaccharide transport system permease protein